MNVAAVTSVPGSGVRFLGFWRGFRRLRPFGTINNPLSGYLDTMTIEKNRAIISGIVRDSSYSSYIGKFVQLVIEDNDGVEVPDKLVWTFCEQQPGGWIPQDAEDPNDRGAFMSWWATDAERKDDVGIPSPNLIPGNLKSCQVYPLQIYEFASMLKWDGAITITQ